MIIVRDVYKDFGSIKALKNVSLNAREGVLALLGPNGAGKTTLIRIMTGYLLPDAGDVIIDGNDIVKNRVKALKKIGYVPENNPLYDDLTPYELIKMYSSLWGVKKTDFLSRIKDVVKELDIADVINQKISTLSKGYKRRVGIAASLIHQPEVLILDEPTDGLDPNQKFVVRQFIKEYAKNNLVVVSTHIMEDVEAIADRVVILDKGMIILDTTPKELKKKSKNNDMVSAFYNITVGNKE